MNNSSSSPFLNGHERIKPLLRWAGGKQQIARKLVEFVPADINERMYREPFLGAGALFFFIQPSRAALSDLNPDLISTYKSVESDAALVARYLRAHATNDSSDYYYQIRDQFNFAPHISAAQAARFIYLNRTCFNGIYRVNLEGGFNVPYGKKDSPIFPGIQHITAAGRALSRARLVHADFETALADAQKGDFVYLDPPYPALNGTSYFAHYTTDRFDRGDQKRLAGLAKDLDNSGCQLLLSNANTRWIRDLYRGFNLRSVGVPRYITSKNKKHEVSELVITNY